MTRLLVSVRDETEAALALAAGVDVIDLKEPAAGPLAAVSKQVVQAVVELVAGRVPVSVACGELVDSSGHSPGPLVAGITYAKLGLAGCRHQAAWPGRWRAWRDRLPAGALPVAVVYADHAQCAAPPPEAVLRLAEQTDCAAVLVDTFSKQSGGLFDHFSLAEVRQFVHQVRGAGRLAVLAGSLKAASLPRALSTAPDLVAVRGAVCRGERHGPIDAEQLAAFVGQVLQLDDATVASDRTRTHPG